MTTQWKVLIVVVIGCAALSQAVKTEWQYMIVRFNWTSTNDQMLAAPLRPVRICPGLYGLSGMIKLGVAVDNTFMFELNVYRSPSGSNNFAMTPYRMPKMPFETLMNTFYRQFAMNDVQSCSDLPHFEGLFKGPVGPVDFHLDKCMLGSDKMPTFVREGFYKIVLKTYSPLVEIVVELVSQVYKNVV